MRRLPPLAPLLPVLVLGLALAPRVPRAEILEEIVARVNDAIITRSELQDRRTQIADNLRQALQGEALRSRLQAAQERVLLDMINEELLLQQAELIYDTDKYYDRLRREFMQTNDVGTEALLAELLAEQGMNVGEFRRLLLRRNVPGDVIQFEVTRKLSVSPGEIRDHYEQHQDAFVEPGEVTLREIVILDQERGHESARELADEIGSRHAAGESFESLAVEHSESPSRESGGLVGPYTVGDLAPALEEQAFSLPVGSVGEPLETSYGFQLIQVEARTETRVVPLDEVTDDVELEVRKVKFEREIETYLTSLWSQNTVVLNPRYATGLLEDGGPYSTREALLPAANPMGPPPVKSTEPGSAP